MKTLVLDTMRSWLAGEPVWPHAKILAEWGPQFENYKRLWARLDYRLPALATMMREMTDMYELRAVWIARYGFAIPCAELLDELATARLVLDIGAGSGYMTRLMLNRGIDTIGSDLEARGVGGYGFDVGSHNPQQLQLSAKEALLCEPEATVFCSWPSLNEAWFGQMLRAMRVGQSLIVVREGACAESAAWDYLDDCFDQRNAIDLPNFPHMNDYADVRIKTRESA